MRGNKVGVADLKRLKKDLQEERERAALAPQRAAAAPARAASPPEDDL
ncbi:MAG TPA: DNA mismatch repair protein MutS, partial [Achromobacter sp.]|nr:DNA mismatch repair protein MutS [Achromobacter sp.]